MNSIHRKIISKKTYAHGRYSLRLALTVMCLFVVAFAYGVYAQETDDPGLSDSGIDYTDGIEKSATKDPNTGNTVMVDALHMNPYRGIHTWAADLVLKNSDDNAAVEPYLAATMKERSLGYLAVDISDFSGAYHLTDGGGRGPDAELTESALNALDRTLKNFKKNNMQVIIRFVYDQGNDSIKPDEGWANENGKRVVEARQSMILTHIGQIAEVLNGNADTILTVQIGFYGHYGELHGSPMCSNNNFKDALKTMLEATRESGIRVSMRTPSKLAYYLDYDISKSADLDAFVQTVTEEDEDAYRAAIFNDGYLGSDSDLGTYYNREKETGWMAMQNLHNPYGGDLVPDPNTGKASVEAQQPKVLKEMAKVHTSYIAPDSRVQTYWEGETYDGSLYDGDAYAKNDPEYEGQSLWTYIENHLGYRFVLRESKLSESVIAGGTLENTFKIENVGFGNLFYPMKSYAYITDEYGKVVVGPTQVDVDPRNFEINTTASGSMDIPVPDDMAPGEYKLYLQFKIDDRKVGEATKPYGAIRLANSNIWNAGLEANYLGSFKVDREVKIIKKWEDASYAKARPDSLTFTIEKTRIPQEYQEVEYIEANGTQWIDTGVASDASYRIYSEGKAYTYFDGSTYTGKTSGLLQSYIDKDDRLGFKLYGGSKKVGCYWRIAGSGQGYKEISTDDLGGIDVTKKLQVTQSTAELVLKQGDLTKTVSLTGAVSGTTGGNWMIFKSDETGSYGVLYEAKIFDSSGLIHHYIPCYRKSDEVIGVYDVVAGRFLTNSGTGVFEKGDDVKYDPLEITIPKSEWIVDGDTWEATAAIDIFDGELSIYEDTVNHYTSDATSDSKKTIENDKVTITNTITEHQWTDATCTAPKTCSTCGYTEGNALGHKWKDATCTSPKTCERCKETEGAAPGHSWAAWKVTKKATEKAAGQKSRTCSICKKTEKATIPKVKLTAPPTGKVNILNTIANSSKKTNDVIWDKSRIKGATNYEINWRTRGASRWSTKTVGNTVRGTTTGLAIKGLYEIRVRAGNSAGRGPWSNTVYRYFHTTEKIRLVSKSKGSFTMSWKSNPEATGYQVMFTTNKNGSGAANNINTVGKTATSFTKSGLKSGTTYYVQVREIKKVGSNTYIGNISCPVAVKTK